MRIHFAVGALTAPALSTAGSRPRSTLPAAAGRRSSAGSDTLRNLIVGPEFFRPTARIAFKRCIGLRRPEPLKVGLSVRRLLGPRFGGSLRGRFLRLRAGTYRNQ